MPVPSKAREPAGLTTQAQTFDPRKWQTDDTWGGIQQFRNRAYDPATGTWIQEDPMGVAGGVNVYRFNNGNPVSFGDPFGLMACPPDCRPLQSVSMAAFGSLGLVAGGIVGLAGGPGTVTLGATTGVVVGATFGLGVANVAEAAVEVGVQVMGKAGRALHKLILFGLLGGAVVDPSTSPQDGDASQSGAGSRAIPESASPPSGTSRPDSGRRVVPRMPRSEQP